MYGVNKVILVGTVGKDPDVHEFKDGGKKASFSLATTKKGYTTKSGATVADKTEWHNVVVISAGLVNITSQYVKKGTNLYVEGELRTRKYNSNGADHYVTEVYVETMHMLPDGKKNNAGNSQSAAAQPSSADNTNTDTISTVNNTVEDSIPVDDSASYLSL